MIELKIKAETIEELKHKIHTIGEQLGTTSSEQQVEVPELEETVTPNPPVEPVIEAPQVPVTIDVPKAPPTSDLDSAGMPWDQRIHSSTRNKTAKGIWKKRRSVDAALVREVESSGAAPVMPTSPQPMPPGAVEPVIPTTAASPPVIEQPVMTPVVPPFNPGNPAHSIETFTANFPMVMADLINQGKITQDYIKDLCTHFEVEELWMVIQDREKLVNLFNSFADYGLITKVEA